MKKCLTIKNVLILATAHLGFIIFFLMFYNQLNVSVAALELSGGLSFSDFFFGTDGINATVLPFIGYLLMIIGALLPLVALLVPALRKGEFCIGLFGALMMLVGAIFVLCSFAAFSHTNSELVKNIYQLLGTIELKASPIIAGILGIVGAVLVPVTYFVLPLVKKSK